MIKSNELRIGNYFQWSAIASMGKGIDKITHGQQIMDYQQFKEPIPLTEERLVRFGYIKMDDFWYTLDDYSLEGDEEGLFLMIDGKEASIKYKYVHEIQNLHFTLTGKELELK